MGLTSRESRAGNSLGPAQMVKAESRSAFKRTVAKGLRIGNRSLPLRKNACPQSDAAMNACRFPGGKNDASGHRSVSLLA
jgi:hypothetical protein